MSTHLAASSGSIGAFGVFGFLAEAHHAFHIATAPFLHCDTIAQCVDVISKLSDLERAGLFMWTGIFVSCPVAALLLIFKTIKTLRIFAKKEI